MRQRQSREDASHEPHFVPARQFMFPNPQHAPAAGAEGAGHEAVAGAVGGDLFAPEGGVGFGRRGVERAAVSEAAVDEDGKFVWAEDEVGFCAEGLQLQTFNFPLERSSSPPAGDAVGAEERDEAQLGGGIAPRADGRHHRRALFARENRTSGTGVLTTDFTAEYPIKPPAPRLCCLLSGSYPCNLWLKSECLGLLV